MALMLQLQLFCVGVLFTVAAHAAQREFRIDFDNNCFVKDGQPFQVISGSIHYYNVPHQLWEDRLRLLRDCGLNTVQTYLEWRTLEPFNGVFDFTGDNDFVRFITTAQRLGLLVNLRLGPYIDSEREMGGLPWWLLQVNSSMGLRRADPEFVKYVARFWVKILPLIRSLLYANGGPIILVQIENEYGSSDACDFVYTSLLRQLVLDALGDNVTLYTTDGSSDSLLKCGKNADVFATVDFGTKVSVSEAFEVQRRHQRRGPLMNSEFYSGWLDLWGVEHQKVNSEAVARVLDDMLAKNASVNIYMFHGGTHFGFNSGSVISGSFKVCPTSYDYDAPVNEAGDPTAKFFAIKDVVKKYVPVPYPAPTVKPKMALGPVVLNKLCGLKALVGALRMISSPTPTDGPLTFEQLNHPYGLIVYETLIPFQPSSPAVLSASGIGDRAYVFVDYHYHGMLSRDVGQLRLAVRARLNSTLTVLVENQGRLTFPGGVRDPKGLLGPVSLGGRQLRQWTHFPVPDQADGDVGYDVVAPFVNDFRRDQLDYSDLRDTENFGVYQGSFTLDDAKTPVLLDTYLRLDGWSKGFVLINDVNLGRYWPLQGPQVTLYVPAVYLVYGRNRITVVELEGAPANKSVTFVAEHQIDGPVPDA